MIEGIPKISVLIICYKQQELIKRAIDSLLVQKDYLYEICVSDDCSPDNTWQVLQNYRSQYPDLIKLHRNEHNVGIFENIEHSWTMPSGDMIYQLSGDDTVVDGYFKAVVNFIEQKKIDYKNEAFAIYGDYRVDYPNGDSKVRHNAAIAKYPNKAIRLAMRSLISNRGTCYSILVLRRFEKVSQGRSHIAEDIQDRLLQINAEKNYYIPVVGNVYVANIGVSAHLSEDIIQERQKIIPYTIDYMKSHGIQLHESDIAFAYYKREMSYFRFKRTFFSLTKAVGYWFKSIDVRLSFIGDEIRTFVFAILRRIPHNKPLQFN